MSGSCDRPAKSDPASAGTFAMNRLGQALYTVSRRRLVLALSLVLAIVATTLAIYRPSLSPVGLHERDLHIAAASTELLVARPSALPDNSIGYEQAVNAGLLAANVMISPAVTDRIGRVMGIDPRLIQGTPPTTSNVPAALIQPGPSGGPEDVFALPDHYKLEIQGDPTAPILFVYTQAPTGSEARKLANAAAEGLIAYVSQMQTSKGVIQRKQLHIEQLGSAEGGVAQTGGIPQIAFLVFAATLIAAFVVLSTLARYLQLLGGRAGRRTHRSALRKIAMYSSE